MRTGSGGGTLGVKAGKINAELSCKVFFLLLFDLCYCYLTSLQSVICIINAYLSVCVYIKYICTQPVYLYICICHVLEVFKYRKEL